MTDRQKLAEILANITNPVLVEGRNDEKALRSFGLDEIFTLSGAPLYEKASEIAEKVGKGEITMMTDFDGEGKRLAGKMRFLLERFGVKVDMKTRLMLMSVSENKCVEELRGDIYAKIGTVYGEVYDKGLIEGRGLC